VRRGLRAASAACPSVATDRPQLASGRLAAWEYIPWHFLFLERPDATVNQHFFSLVFRSIITTVESGRSRLVFGLQNCSDFVTQRRVYAYRHPYTGYRMRSTISCSLPKHLARIVVFYKYSHRLHGMHYTTYRDKTHKRWKIR
jgi:hypothetical protein